MRESNAKFEDTTQNGYCKTVQIWLKNMAEDNRFLKVNLMIARIFFGMNAESNYFKGLNSGRFEVKVSVECDG